MDRTEESTPHPEARAYSSTYEGGEVMQQFEVENTEGAMDLQTTEKQRATAFPVRSEGKYSSPTNPWPRDPEAEAQVCKRGNLHTRGKAQAIAGTSMVSPCLQLLQRHTSRVSK